MIEVKSTKSGRKQLNNVQIMWSKNAVFHKTRILRVFLIRQTGSFPLKGEQSRNMSVPSPHQQTFFVSVLLFFYPPSVWKNMYECVQFLPFLSWLCEIVC